MPAAKLLGSLAALSLILASPTVAQSIATSPMATAVATDVAFFERVQLGGLDLSAANIFYDTRCVDREFCFRSDSVAISVVLFTKKGPREVILRLFEPTRVPGGLLTLTNTGTPPRNNGAIALEDYQLELVFTPTPERDR